MEQVSRFARRFQLKGATSSRAGELYRLAEVKGVRGVSLAGLALACLEIAAGQLGEAFDKTQAQRLSGLQPKAYCRAVQSVCKILNISSTTSSVSLREMAVRFGCLEAEQLAMDILERYREKMEATYSEIQRESLDLSQPLYPAAALYTACKAMKFHSDKSQFQSVGCCSSRSLFQTITDQMKDCIPKKEANTSRKRKRADKPTAPKTISLSCDDTTRHLNNSPHSTAEVESPPQDQPQRLRGATKPSKRTKVAREGLWTRVVSSPASCDYLEWKESVLTAARTKLAHSQ